MHALKQALALAGICVTTAGHAQSAGGVAAFPQKPLRIIVSSAPGGGQDLTTRPIAQKLAEALGVPVVVDNRGGASGIVAMDVTRQAAPDGYTLLVGATSMILMGVTNKVTYDIRKAFDPLVPLTSQPYLFVLHPSVPATSPKEFVAFAKTKPGILTYGTSGPGSLHPRPVQRKRPRPDRLAGRTDQPDVHEHDLGRCARQERQAAGHRRDESGAACRVP
jgi:tripartite-type tricarboxylate transporter receptor subunit TctC